METQQQVFKRKCHVTSIFSLFVVCPAGMCAWRCCRARRPLPASSEHAACCLGTSWRSTRCSACRYPTVHCGRKRCGSTSATPASRATRNVWLVEVSALWISCLTSLSSVCKWTLKGSFRV